MFYSQLTSLLCEAIDGTSSSTSIQVQWCDRNLVGNKHVCTTKLALTSGQPHNIAHSTVLIGIKGIANCDWIF